MSGQQELTKARKYCSYQERSQQELRDKLYDWGLHKKEVEEAIALMITEGFLNEERFAIAFAGGKFRIKSWGKIKISMALKQKKVSENCIRTALRGIDEKEYRRSLAAVIERYGSRNMLKQPYLEKQRIARYAIGKGYEPDLVWSLLREKHGA